MIGVQSNILSLNQQWLKDSNTELIWAFVGTPGQTINPWTPAYFVNTQRIYKKVTGIATFNGLATYTNLSNPWQYNLSLSIYSQFMLTVVDRDDNILIDKYPILDLSISGNQWNTRRFDMNNVSWQKSYVMCSNAIASLDPVYKPSIVLNVMFED